MNNQPLRQLLDSTLKDNANYQKEIERLHSIIKEVREYIEKNTDNTNFLEVPSKELLEILNKVSK